MGEDRAATDEERSARDYDRWFDEPWGRYASSVETEAIHEALPLRCHRILDAGCGTGRFSAALSDAGRIVVGVDKDPGMLTIASTRLLGGCVRSRLEALPFADHSFDVTIAVTVLEFVSDPSAVIAELARVTRPGGRIIIGALNPRSPWGLANRRRLRSGIWCRARFLTRRELELLAAPHGRAAIRSHLYAPAGFPGLSRIGPLLETMGRLAPTWGAFTALAVDRSDHATPNGVPSRT